MNKDTKTQILIRICEGKGVLTVCREMGLHEKMVVDWLGTDSAFLERVLFEEDKALKEKTNG